MQQENAGGSRYVLGIDVGGTHTDIELIDLANGTIYRHKIASTPHEPARAVRQGTQEIVTLSGIDPGQVIYFAHGTTVATNALVQNKGGAAALITSKGFRDILDIRRQRQPHVYNTRVAKPPPPIPRSMRFEIDERHFLFGLEDSQPKEEEIVELAQVLKQRGVRSIAVCLMHSYHDDRHEKIVGDLLRRTLPDAFVCLSSDVLREIREYERMSTTALNAVLGPVMHAYLSSVSEDTAATGLQVEPKIMQSNGGVASPRDAATLPISALASGPAAGVIGAINVASQIGLHDIITFDLGGTTTDVCLVENGSPLLTVEREFGGYPVRFPMVDVLSVGAGGGSIAWVDSGGFLHVGPQSAGADPGPACYAKGGTDPTVTDANLVLGRLNSGGLLGGRMPVDMEAARQAILDKVARPLGMSLEQAAVGILTIVNENMVQAVRVTSVERGFDPREFALVAFGGGGPLMAGKLARELGMKRVVIPRSPGLLCAEGLLLADIRSDFSATCILDASPSNEETIRVQFVALAERARLWFEREGVRKDARTESYAVDMRYKGQSHELRIAVPSGVDAISIEALREAFVAEHHKAFGFSSEAAVECVTFRVTASTPNHHRPTEPEAGDNGVRAVPAARQVYFERLNGFVECPIHLREHVRSTIAGPAIIEQMDSTIVVGPGERIEPADGGNLLLHID